MRTTAATLAILASLVFASTSFAAGTGTQQTDPSAARGGTQLLDSIPLFGDLSSARVHQASPADGGRTATRSTSASASTSTTASTPPVLGVFDISTAAQMSQWKSAGGNAIMIPVYWQLAQTAQGGAVSLSGAGNDGDNVISEIQQAHADGLAVYLEIDLQYPPSWVLSAIPAFVDQGGTSWSDSQSSGGNVRDWIWTAVGRQDVSSFVAGTLTDLKSVMSDISGIRSGGGMFGELDYPSDGSTVNGIPSMWGYDSAAQTGAGLAAGESKTPLPGYVYGTGTSAENTEWANWYLGSLATWIQWYAKLLRTDGWSGPTYVLNPSFGLRTNMTPGSAAYDQQLAYGSDPATMMNAYDQVAGVYPWADWTDDTQPYWYQGDPTATDAAEWEYLLELAQQRGLAGHIMGENTGGGGGPAIQQMMSGSLASGYQGEFYNDYTYLEVNGLESYLVSQFDTYEP